MNNEQYKRAILVLLVLFFLIVPVLGSDFETRPKTYSGINLQPYLNVSTGLGPGNHFSNTSLTYNVSSWMTTTVGKITETLWVPFEFWIMFFLLGIGCLILSALIKNNPYAGMVLAILALAFIGILYANNGGALIGYHGIGVLQFDNGPITDPKTDLEILTQVQPWQELYLMNWGLVYVMQVLFWLCLANFIISMYYVIYALIHPKPILDGKPER